MPKNFAMVGGSLGWPFGKGLCIFLAFGPNNVMGRAEYEMLKM
jgi:hypothetical protein